MPDARVLVGIATVVGLALLGLIVFVIERRHAARRRTTGAERLPLFGTEQLAIRTPDGYEEGSADDDATARSGPVRARAAIEGDGATTPRPVATKPLTADVAPAAERSARATSSGQPAARPADFFPRTAAVRPPAPSLSTKNGTPARELSSAGRAHAATSGTTATDASEAPPIDTALIEGETLRFTLPTDGTVEFLPGHLEVVAGPDSGKEIRFVRSPGDADVEVTFGRSEGPAHRHIQILARTVSRRHAVMSLIDDHWQLTNLSSTNPLILNGRVLAGDEVAPLLVEGDRIEMGEVVFVYHDA